MTSLAKVPTEKRCHKYIYNLIYSTDICWQCQGQLLWRKSYAWCRTCRLKISAKAQCWLKGSNLSHQTIFRLVWCWQNRKSPGFCKDSLGLSYRTVARWYERFRLNVPPDKTRPLSGVVEIDESFFGKLRFGGQTIVVGAIERDTRRIKLRIISDREQETIEDFVLTWVKGGTAVMTDLHWGYAELNLLGYSHEAYNHSRGYFKETNAIENLWGVIKRYLRRLYGCVPTKQLQLILNEWMARQNTPHIFSTPQDYLNTTLFRIG